MLFDLSIGENNGHHRIFIVPFEDTNQVHIKSSLSLKDYQWIEGVAGVKIQKFHLLATTIQIIALVPLENYSDILAAAVAFDIKLQIIPTNIFNIIQRKNVQFDRARLNILPVYQFVFIPERIG